MLNRLTQVVNPLPTNPLETFNYDPVGNRSNSNQNGSSIFNMANQLLEDANFTYQYDNNGNMIQKTAKIGGTVTNYEYDAENKLVRVVSPTNTANYRYDGLGRRVEKEIIAGSTTISRYVYDNEDILLELNGANAIVARYTHGPGIDEPLIMEKNSQSFYYHADGLGSITEISNQSGTVSQRYTYSSFGKIESQQDPNFAQAYTFTAREFDLETGLSFYRARFYDASTGRFLQEDPIKLDGGINFYSYFGGNPLSFVDPFGLVRSTDAAILRAIARGDLEELKLLLDVVPNISKATSEALLKQCVQNIPKDVGKIAKQLGRSPKDVRTAIENIKDKNLSRGGPKRNPEVRIDRQGNVYPETPNGVGDSIGNILDFLP